MFSFSIHLVQIRGVAFCRFFVRAGYSGFSLTFSSVLVLSPANSKIFPLITQIVVASQLIAVFRWGGFVITKYLPNCQEFGLNFFKSFVIKSYFLFLLTMLYSNNCYFGVNWSILHLTDFLELICFSLIYIQEWDKYTRAVAKEFDAQFFLIEENQILCSVFGSRFYKQVLYYS